MKCKGTRGRVFESSDLEVASSLTNLSEFFTKRELHGSLQMVVELGLGRRGVFLTLGIFSITLLGRLLKL